MQGFYIQQALERDGAFFDMGEAWDLVQQSGIAPWLVNEAFLVQQLEKGVESILFVGEDVDRIISIYKDVPFEQIDKYRYREVIWLEQNAHRYGYTREGNQWVRRP